MQLRRHLPPFPAVVFALALLVAPLVGACGIAPDAQNATCCECAGFDGSGHACHWCPPPVGGCHYSGSAEYRCAGFVTLRADCPTQCPPIGPSGTATSTPSPTPSPASLSRTPSPRSASPSPAPPPPLRPFSKKGVGYYGGQCGDFGGQGLSNISWWYDWGHDQASLYRSGCASSGPSHAMLGAEYVPMIWGKYALKNITEMNVTFIQGASSIFSFNEPDHSVRLGGCVRVNTVPCPRHLFFSPSLPSRVPLGCPPRRLQNAGPQWSLSLALST